ncbi:MAG TPA: YggT family protein [Candidatus Omnitrophota bacterium]|nr:YggT family protein [Candidatus Omnitrophota bacterium]
MFILGEILNGLAFIIQAVVTVLMWIIIIQAVLTWVLSPYHPYVQLLAQASDPVLKPFRRLPLTVGTFDFTPLVAVVVLHVIKNILLRIIMMGVQYFGT